MTNYDRPLTRTCRACGDTFDAKSQRSGCSAACAAVLLARNPTKVIPKGAEAELFAQLACVLGDGAVAERLGVSHQQVRRLRERLGVETPMPLARAEGLAELCHASVGGPIYNGRMSNRGVPEIDWCASVDVFREWPMSTVARAWGRNPSSVSAAVKRTLERLHLDLTPPSAAQKYRSLLDEMEAFLRKEMGDGAPVV